MIQAGAGEADFAARAERHRRELHIHCYRMLGSFQEAEDAVQDTFLRAWSHRATVEAGSGFRAWLYRIATNACLDALRRRKRRGVEVHSPADLPWLQPYPDRLLDEIAPREDEPDAVLVSRETIELAYIALIQLLPPRQRAVLILREVLGWPAADVAAVLEISVAAVNSALQRARATIEQHRPSRDAGPPEGELTDTERALLQGFIAAHEQADAEAALALMREDIRITMPPHPWLFEGVEAIVPLLTGGLTGPGEWRLVPTRANRQPTAATYLREWDGTEWRALKFDVLRIEDGKIAEITTFGADLFPDFGLPLLLQP